MKSFSAYAGGFALAVIMLPIVARTTEEMVCSWCRTRCARRRWRSACRRGARRLRVVLRTARGGIITGIMLAVARVAGETAPLLFTAFGNQFWQHGLRIADLVAAGADLHLCDLAVRRLAPPGLGRRAGAC